MYNENFHVAILLAYVVVGACTIAYLRGIKGVLAAVIIGWLFLSPLIGIDLPGLPRFNKDAAVAYAIVLGMLMVEGKAIAAFRPKLLDIPMLVWIIVPFFSSITNGLGVTDGLSEIYLRLMSWGIPYFAGRVLIRSPRDVRDAAIWIVLSGLIAVPFALWEIRMSPHLHDTVYGFPVARFHMAIRLGGYRPMLFMRHGLEVGLWMATASAAGLWLLLAGRGTVRLLGYKINSFSLVLFATTILCRSLGSLILLFGTTAAALFVRSTGLRLVFIALLLTPSVYLSVRLTNIVQAEQLSSIIAIYNPDRAFSFESRLNQEEFISDHALKRPVFGWGGHNRYRPTNEFDETTPVDSLTMITLGKNGVIGLVTLLAMNLIPPLLIVLKLPGKELARPFWAPTIAILLGVTIYSMDALFNAFATPVHIVGLGALAAVATQVQPWRAKLRESQRAQFEERMKSMQHNADEHEDQTQGSSEQ
jgi:hypothetical protein